MGKPSLILYNTQTRKKEEITPLDGKKIRMYTCGPTVYNFAHIGNFRTYVFEDLLRRTIRFFGFEVEQVMNLTDIDDKTIKGALEKKVSLSAFTQPFKDAFLEDVATLGIERVEHYPQATDYIPEMITLIQGLLDKKIAYKGQDGSIYFSIQHFPSYGKLSHLDLESLKAGASNRVAADEYEKENVSDFVLWKAYDSTRDGPIFWESPFGRGRPGWHIECSAMAMKLLGQTLDIHVGGVDNMFPHHENEIAQSEAYSGKPFVRHWLHVEHLLVEHKKMSKSLGNFYTLRDLLHRGFTGMQVRYLLLQTHYRVQQNFTFEGLHAAVASLDRLSAFVIRLKEIRKEKMQTALGVILDKALPEHPTKRQVKDHILFDVQKEMDRHILDAEQMRPLLERSLSFSEKKEALVKDILTRFSLEQQKTVLVPILREALRSTPHSEQLLSSILHDVQDEHQINILDASTMQRVLQRSLQSTPHSQEAIVQVLSKLKEKKDRGFVLPILVSTMRQFGEALADDINISVALASVFEMVREVNLLCDQQRIGISEAEDVLDFLYKIDQVLGIIPLKAQEEDVPPELEQLLKEREKARVAREWKKADAYRDQIASRGYVIEDTAQGARLKKR